MRCWKQSRQYTGRPWLGLNGTVVFFPHAEQVACVSVRSRPAAGPPARRSPRFPLHALQRFGQPCMRVKMRVRAMRGGMSGGTVASLMNVVKEAAADPALDCALQACGPMRMLAHEQAFVFGLQPAQLRVHAHGPGVVVGPRCPLHGVIVGADHDERLVASQRAATGAVGATCFRISSRFAVVSTC